MAASIGKLILGSSSCKNEMPILGLGTASYPFSAEQVKAAVLTAIKLGYRHFDTASLYGTEQTLGEAVREAVKLGLIKSRDELFITSKLWCSDAHPNLVLPAIQKSLRTLQMEYLDLYLVHWPLSVTPGKFDFPAPAKEDLLPMDYESVWSQMEECQKLGLTKSIGVSNFTCKKLDTILATAKIPPAVNQVEMNIIWQQKKLVAYCKDKGIIITAFSPLGASGTSWGTNNVMESEVLNEIAKATGKSNAQICLRWLVEQGASIVVKSFNEQRMKENMDIFDWELNAEQLKTISGIPQRRGYPGDVFISPTGPFKNEEELWDGEV